MKKKFSLGRLLVGYEKTEVGGVSGKSFFVRDITGSPYRLRGMETGRLKAIIARISRIVSGTSARAYGLFLLGFGIITMLVHFIKDYFGIYESMPLSVLVVGTVISIISVPLIAQDKPIGASVADFRLTSFIFFDFFSIKRVHPDSSVKGINPLFAMLIGMSIGGLGSVINPTYIAYAIAGTVYLYLTFLSPEFSFFSIFLALPYISLIPNHEYFLAALVAATLLSFVRKVTEGKRVYSFEQYDLELFLMLLFVLISGIFVKGIESFASSVMMILLAMGYTVSGNLIVNRRLADSAINAIIISSVPVSVTAIVQFIVKWADIGALPSVGVCATFDSPATLAVFLLVSFGFAAYFVHSSRSSARRLLYGGVMLLCGFGLITSLCIWLVCAVLFGLFALIAVRGRKLIGLSLGIFGGAFYLLLLLAPEAVKEVSDLPLLSSLNLYETVKLWRTSFEMFFDNLFTGIGMGSDSFLKEYATYESDVRLNSSSFLLEIGLEAGIFALAFFLIIMLVRLIHRSRYRRYLIDSQLNTVSHTCASVTVALMVFGVFNYIWEDMSMYYLFWCVFGMGSASLRIAKREFDDRVAYFSDGRSVHSSAVDIALK